MVLVLVEVKTASERAFLISPKDIAALPEKPDLLWLTQPNNPSGIFLDPERLRTISRELPQARHLRVL
jgi:histidinol-phosphate/aromatic aminotransferase/cobyric acid decarboxylase-like protein